MHLHIWTSLLYNIVLYCTELMDKDAIILGTFLFLFLDSNGIYVHMDAMLWIKFMICYPSFCFMI